MILTKGDYFARSREQNVPNRCPILNRCARRIATIKSANEGITFKNLEAQKPEVPISGDGPYTIGGSEDSFLIGGACPEVALFEPNFFIIGLNKTPTTKGQYDKYMDPQYEVLETGHFSECAEYSLAITDPTLAPQRSVEQEIAGSILAKLDELLAAVQEAKLDEATKRTAAASIEEARKAPSSKSMKTLDDRMRQLSSLVDSGAKLAIRAEEFSRWIKFLWS